jgi:hypothetical protein
MDNYRLGEVATDFAPLFSKVDLENQRLTQRVELLEGRLNDLITLLIPARLEKIEQRLDLMIALKTNKLDLSKFTCDIPSLGLPLRKVES